MATSETLEQEYVLPEDELPIVSVLIPVRNEAGFIGRCLSALAVQDYPRDRFEVFVLDGESTDLTEHEAQHAAETFELTIFVATNPGRTTAAGLNLGLTLIHGHVVIRVDGHTRVAPDFISANVRALRESGADAVGGPIETRGHGTAGRAIALAMSSPFGVGDAAFRHSQTEQWTDSVPFAAYRREVFERIGGFAEDIDRGEDDEFNYRLRSAGGRVLLTPSIRSVYFARENFGGLLRQYWGYGIAKVNVLRRHPRRLRPRHLIPSAFVITLAGSAVLGVVVDGRFFWLTAAVGGAYAVANLGASLNIASKGHWRDAALLPVAFACIHVAAGAGMIAGVLRLLWPFGRR
ncbi:MAG TPA: glycosyltransferase family 2 protein [Dehalococcoidia bacterium]|nr:glycosyltransferase family 2 protein [Dehalococcoidia bacterium]